MYKLLLKQNMRIIRRTTFAIGQSGHSKCLLRDKHTHTQKKQNTKHKTKQDKMHLLPSERRMVFSPGSHFVSLILFELKIHLLSFYMGKRKGYCQRRWAKILKRVWKRLKCQTISKRMLSISEFRLRNELMSALCFLFSIESTCLHNVMLSLSVRFWAFKSILIITYEPSKNVIQYRPNTR